MQKGERCTLGSSPLYSNAVPVETSNHKKLIFRGASSENNPQTRSCRLQTPLLRLAFRLGLSNNARGLGNKLQHLSLAISFPTGRTNKCLKSSGNFNGKKGGVLPQALESRRGSVSQFSNGKMGGLQLRKSIPTSTLQLTWRYSKLYWIIGMA